MKSIYTSKGLPGPLGASITETGINFAFYSMAATKVILIIHKNNLNQKTEIEMDALKNRTGDIWHIHIEGLKLPVIYSYRISNPEKVFDNVIDPYARILTGAEIWHKRSSTVFKSVLNLTSIDWERDHPPQIALSDSIIYELHVRGFTRHHSSATNNPGTFSGLTDKIPYLKELGITAVELLPVTEFDESGNHRKSPVGKNLYNFWGYDPVNFFAVKAGYSKVDVPGDQLNEFKTMVREFHKAGIEIILDVVFNHTFFEGMEYFCGPDAATYFMMNPDKSQLLNFSGCGNSVNANHPVVSDLIISALRFWVSEMHVDGFRFDLASVLCRAEDGTVLKSPPVIERITGDPVLSNVKLIAEAWDAAGLYQVGSFPGSKRWAEWNGRFRDDLRRYIKGDAGVAPIMAARLTGSADIYRNSGRMPYHSINFVTCHDGFTLNDLVTYNRKHNKKNGENNRDGTDQNFSWNCGTEGPSNNQKIVHLRQKQIRNFYCFMLISQGVPMILAGDEMARTQWGNNNSYCQDNEIGWINWKLLEQEKHLFRFVKLMIAFRKAHPSLRRKKFFEDDNSKEIKIEWHGRQLLKPDWSPVSRELIFRLFPVENDLHEIFVISNACPRKHKYQLPAPDHGKSWYLKVDTDLIPPQEIYEPGNEVALADQSEYHAAAHSTVILISK